MKAKLCYADHGPEQSVWMGHEGRNVEVASSIGDLTSFGLILILEVSHELQSQQKCICSNSANSIHANYTRLRCRTDSADSRFRAGWPFSEACGSRRKHQRPRLLPPPDR